MTEIVNSGATLYDGKYNICERTGFKARPYELIVTWDNLKILPYYDDGRHPQEFARAVTENRKRGALRPEPRAGDETFVTTVTIDDL